MTTDSSGPMSVLKLAIKNVPVVKYALGIAGIVAAIEIISFFGPTNVGIPVYNILIMLGLMILLFVFASLTTSKDKVLRVAGYILVYFVVFLTIGVSSVLAYNYVTHLNQVADKSGPKPVPPVPDTSRVKPDDTRRMPPGGSDNSGTTPDKPQHKKLTAEDCRLQFDPASLEIQIFEKRSGSPVAPDKDIKLSFNQDLITGPPSCTLYSCHPIIYIDGRPRVTLSEYALPNIGPVGSRELVVNEANAVLKDVPTKYLINKLPTILLWLEK